jgi:hypothetical protein
MLWKLCAKIKNECHYKRIGGIILPHDSAISIWRTECRTERRVIRGARDVPHTALDYLWTIKGSIGSRCAGGCGTVVWTAVSGILTCVICRRVRHLDFCQNASVEGLYLLPTVSWGSICEIITTTHLAIWRMLTSAVNIIVRVNCTENVYQACAEFL